MSEKYIPNQYVGIKKGGSLEDISKISGATALDAFAIEDDSIVLFEATEFKTLLRVRRSGYSLDRNWLHQIPDEEN